MRTGTRRSIERIMGRYFKEQHKKEQEELRSKSKVETINKFKETRCSKCKNQNSDKCNIRRNTDMQLVCKGEEIC